MTTRRKVLPEPPVATYQTGIDGWPVGRNEAAIEKASERQREIWLQGRMRVCENAFQKDAYGPALMEALQLCINYKRPLPDWLARQVWALMSRLYNKSKNRKRFDPMTERRLKHVKRWDAVNFVWENRKEVERRDRALGVNPDLIPLKWDHVFDYAARYLGKAETASAVEKSYKMVQAAFKRGDAHKWMVAHLGDENG
jgi:hypothetical protein